MMAAADSGVRFREATPADLPLLGAYMRALRLEDPFPAPVDESVGDAAVAGLLDDPALGRAWVIYDGDDRVGYVVLTFTYSIEFGGRAAFIDELYVAPDRRGRGIGRQTLAFLSEFSAAMHVRVLLLEVTPTNEAARRLYSSAGFAERTYRLMTRRVDH
jgi:ribosomal protein S18 acetylase RimI-like enzyme